TGIGPAHVRAVVGRRWLSSAGKEATTQRGVGDETDPELVEGREERLDVSLEQRVLGLQDRDRMYEMRLANGLRPGLTESEKPDLARVDEVLHRAGDLLDRHLWVHPVLVEHIDAVHVEVAQAVVDDFTDVLGPTVVAIVARETELRRDDDV